MRLLDKLETQGVLCVYFPSERNSKNLAVRANQLPGVEEGRKTPLRLWGFNASYRLGEFHNNISVSDVKYECWVFFFGEICSPLMFQIAVKSLRRSMCLPPRLRLRLEKIDRRAGDLIMYCRVFHTHKSCPSRAVLSRISLEHTMLHVSVPWVMLYAHAIHLLICICYGFAILPFVYNLYALSISSSWFNILSTTFE